MQTEPRSVTRPRDRARVRLRLRNNPASYLGRSTFRPAALASRRQMRPTFCCSRSSLLRHRARTSGHVPRTSGPRRQVSARSRHNRCLRRTRTRTCFPPSSGSPICCAPTHRGQLASPRVRPCRSTRRRLNKSIRKTRTEAAFDNRVGSANEHQILILAPARLNESRRAPPHFPANAITTLEELFSCCTLPCTMTDTAIQH